MPASNRSDVAVPPGAESSVFQAARLLLRPRGELGELVDAQPARTPAEQRQRVERSVTRLLPDREDRAHRVPDRDAPRCGIGASPASADAVGRCAVTCSTTKASTSATSSDVYSVGVVDAAARADAEMIDGHHDEAPRGHVLGEAVVPERSAAHRCASSPARSRRRGSRTAPPAIRRDASSASARANTSTTTISPPAGALSTTSTSMVSRSISVTTVGGSRDRASPSSASPRPRRAGLRGGPSSSRSSRAARRAASRRRAWLPVRSRHRPVEVDEHLQAVADHAGAAPQDRRCRDASALSAIVSSGSVSASGTFENVTRLSVAAAAWGEMVFTATPVPCSSEASEADPAVEESLGAAVDRAEL